MGKVLTVSIHKGGTGKTAIATHIPIYAQEKLNLSVLVIDLDPQGNLTQFFDTRTDLKGSSLLFSKKIPSVVEINDKLHLIPADEKNLYGVEKLTNHFKNNIKKLSQDYDLIVIDTPPTMGFLMLAPLISSDFVLSPIKPSVQAIAGVKSLFEKIQWVQSTHNTKLAFLGLLINDWDKKSKIENDIVNDLKNKIADRLFKQSLAHRPAAFSRSAFNKTAIFHRPMGGAAKTAAAEMRKVMDEIMTKIQMVNKK